MPEELLSVVVCTYNRADSLAIALATVVAQQADPGFAVEVVVIDDGSTDATRETVERIASSTPIPVRYVFKDSKNGVAAARNLGIENARGTCVVFFDDDQLASPDWLAGLYSVKHNHAAQCIGGARKLDLSAEVLRGLGPICRGVLGENLYEDPPIPLRGKELPSTGSLLVAKTVFEKVGPFDTRLSAGEDAEFLGRCRANGIDVWTAPRAMVAHMIPPHRQGSPYFRWVSLRWGSQFARIDAKAKGTVMALALAAARLAQALLITSPKLVLANARGNQASAMDCRCLLWRAWGYARTAAHLAAPGVFPQTAFFEFIEFRGERTLFANQQAAA